MMFRPVLLFFIIFILAVLFILYQLREKLAESEGFIAKYVGFDAGGNDQRSPTRNTTDAVCNQKCADLGASCPGFVMDYRTDGGRPRNNCWLKTNGANGTKMSYAPGVTTFTMNTLADFKCPNPDSMPAGDPTSDPIKSIVVADWDVAQIKSIHSSIRATNGGTSSFYISDADMPAYIQSQVSIKTPYSAVNSSSNAAIGSGTACPTPTKKWMFNDYSAIVQGYLKNNVVDYESFQKQQKLNKAGFRGIEGLTNSLVNTNITDKIIADAKNVGFTVTPDFINTYSDQIYTYVTQANSSKIGFFKKLINFGINSSDEYIKLLNEMVGSGQSPQNPKGIGFVITSYSPWIVDTLPAYGITSAATMKIFRDDINSGVYYNFGFKTPFYPTEDKQAHQVYFWYLYELTKLGIGVKEFKEFASIHSSVFNVRPDTGSKMDLNSGSWEPVKMFPTDPFLPLVSVYSTMGFQYNTGATPAESATNFKTFCATVKQLPPPQLIDKLKMFSDRMREYGMSSFMEYSVFVNYLTTTVGNVGDLVSMMKTVKTYITQISGLTIPTGSYKTGKVTLSDGSTVDIFDYKLVKWLIDNLTTNNNKYGLSPLGGIPFTRYVNNLIAQNWKFNTTVGPTTSAGAKYYESEARSVHASNKNYGAQLYNESSDPSKMIKQGFGNMQDNQGDWIGAFSDWVVSLFSSEQEGLTNNRVSDHEMLKQFGVNDADKQLPPIIKTFKDDYGVTDFNEMIYLISCLRRIGVQCTDLIPMKESDNTPCLQQLKKYRITKPNLDVFTQHMNNAGFKTWTGPFGVYTFINITSDFGVNTNALNYKQFIYMIRKFGGNFNSQTDLQSVYVLTWVCNFIGVKYDNANQIANMDFSKLPSISNKDSANRQLWKSYVNNFAYSKKDSSLEKMHAADKTDYRVYRFDNFIDNCVGRGYQLKNFDNIINRIIFPMYILNRSASSLNKYANYADLFNYVNIRNAPFMPMNNKGKMDGQYLINELQNYPDGSMYDRLVGFFFQQNDWTTDSNIWKKLIAYLDNDLMDLTKDPNYPNKDKFEMPFRVTDMMSFVYEDEMQALAGNNSAKYTELFGSDDKIIEYMMDMVTGMKSWMDDISKNLPFDSEKYNNIIPTANAIILHPIYMFRWMEKQIQENKPQCTADAMKTHTDQTKCYQKIATSQMARRRASYLDPPVKHNSSA